MKIDSKRLFFIEYCITVFCVSLFTLISIDYPITDEAIWRSQFNLLTQLSISTLSLLSVFIVFYKKWVVDTNQATEYEIDLAGQKSTPLLDYELDQLNARSETIEKSFLEIEKDLEQVTSEFRSRYQKDIEDFVCSTRRTKKKVRQYDMIRSICSKGLPGDDEKKQTLILPIGGIAISAMVSLLVLTGSRFGQWQLPYASNIISGLLTFDWVLYTISIVWFALFFINFVNGTLFKSQQNLCLKCKKIFKEINDELDIQNNILYNVEGRLASDLKKEKDKVGDVSLQK